MKYILYALFLIIVVLLGIGYYIKHVGQMILGDQLIGISVLIATFILMPLFIYYRWKDKKVKDYMLTEDNIQKMRAFNDDKKKRT